MFTNDPFTGTPSASKEQAMVLYATGEASLQTGRRVG
jgi:hypothetical protein